MQQRSSRAGLAIAVLAAASFGFSGPFVKPLLEAGWSPSAAVAVRAAIGAVVLAPLALHSLRGRWATVWPARWRILGMAVLGVVGTQFFYFAAVERIPVGTAILIEYMAPLVLVGVAWVVTRRMPQRVVLIGSVSAFAGLILVVSPSGASTLDPLGLASALAAMLCCAAYFVIAARPTAGLPPLALAGLGLAIAPFVLALTSLVGLAPFQTTTADVSMLDTLVPWWVPLLVVGVVSTAVSYAASITATSMLGSRLASFVGLLEVAAAAVVAWLLLGEVLTLLQFAGAVLILAGIAFVRSAKPDAELAVVVGPDLGPGATAGVTHRGRIRRSSRVG
ncbi:EamA family transporter [Marisediminicola sp. LYQ85]|uniref:EamA family transporter n=1 Tax=Marisediminicola sp. LYQ85 TaxID=3391062 RepID=UPI0039839548